MGEYSIGRTIAGCAIGLALAVLGMPILLPLSVFFAVPVLVLLVLYARFGPVSAVISTALCVASAAGTMGVAGAGAALLLVALPACVGFALLWRKAGYGLRMKAAVAAQALGFAGFLLATTLVTGMGLADAFTQMVGEQLSAMPAGFVDYYLAMVGAVQLPQAEGIDLLHGVLEAQERAQLLEETLALQNTMLRLSLPTMIASSSLYSGILCCHVPSTMLARRGADIEHKTLDKWRLGRDLTIFAALCFVTGLYFLLFNRSDAAAPAYLVFQTIADIAFSMQGLAAVDRAMVRSGQSRGKRTWILVGLFALNQLTQYGGISALALIGFASAMWGSQGIVTLRRKRRKAQNDEDHRNGGGFE